MKYRQISTSTFWLFLGPVLLAFILVIVVPFFLGVYFGFTDWSSSARQSDTQFVGWENYRKSLEDPRFLYSFFVTSVYTVLNMFSVNAVAFLLALLVSTQVRGSHFYRAAFFVPNMIGGLVLGFVWQFIFNQVLPVLAPLVGQDWLALPENLLLARNTSAILALVLVGTWQYAGYIMMIYLTAIQAIPTELHEAADIDGVNYLERLRHITIPLVAQAFTVTLFLTLVNSFKQFDVNVSLTAGGPATTFLDQSVYGTQLLALNIYTTAFAGNDLAQGQARAFLFFAVLAIVSIIQVRANKRKEIEL